MQVEQVGFDVLGAQVLAPALLVVTEPDELGGRVDPVRFVNGLLVPVEPAPAVVVGDGQGGEVERGRGPEGVPGFGERVRVRLGAGPALVGLRGDQALPGDDVHPLQGDVPGVAVEDELVQGGPADGLAATGQDDGEQQLEQNGLSPAVLKHEQRVRGRPAAGCVEQARGRDGLADAG